MAARRATRRSIISRDRPRQSEAKRRRPAAHPRVGGRRPEESRLRHHGAEAVAPGAAPGGERLPVMRSSSLTDAESRHGYCRATAAGEAVEHGSSPDLFAAVRDRRRRSATRLRARERPPRCSPVHPTVVERRRIVAERAFLRRFDRARAVVGERELLATRLYAPLYTMWTRRVPATAARGRKEQRRLAALDVALACGRARHTLEDVALVRRGASPG